MTSEHDEVLREFAGPEWDAARYVRYSTSKRMAEAIATLRAENAALKEDAVVTRYTVGGLDNRNTAHRAIHVEYAGRGRWAVRRNGLCLGTDGGWDYEPLPSSRDDEWLAEFRFPDAQTAITAARAAGASDE
jgi:hypothetical protein